MLILTNRFYSPEGTEGASNGGGTTALAQVGATQAAAATTQQAEATHTTNSGDFFSMSFKDLPAEKLPEDLRDWGTLKKYPTAADQVRAHRELEKAWNSRQQLKPPGEGAKPEEVQAWRDLLGVPKTPEEYGLKAPEKLPEGVQWNQEFAGEFSKLAHELNLPVAAVQKLVDFHNAHLGKMTESAKAEQTAQVETAKAELQKMWGAEAPRNAAMVQEYATMIGLDINEVGNNPKVIASLHKAADMLNKLTREPGALITGDVPGMAQTAQALYDKITSSDDFKGVNGQEKAKAALEAAHRAFKAIPQKK